jgi:hypothetical protein
MHMDPSSVFCSVISVVYIFDDVRNRRDRNENVFIVIDSCRFDDLHGISLWVMFL